jgi:hypothetical protein
LSKKEVKGIKGYKETLFLFVPGQSLSFKNKIIRD